MIIFILSLYAAIILLRLRAKAIGDHPGMESGAVMTLASFSVTLRPHFMSIFHFDSYCLTLAINLDFGPRATVGWGMSAPFCGNLSW